MLERLASGGPQTVPQIARALDVGRQFIQRRSDDAAAAGLVSAESNPAHQRSPLLRLTEKGEEKFDAIRKREQAITRRVAVGLTERDVAAAARGRCRAARRLLSLRVSACRSPAQ